MANEEKNKPRGQIAAKLGANGGCRQNANITMGSSSDQQSLQAG